MKLMNMINRFEYNKNIKNNTIYNLFNRINESNGRKYKNWLSIEHI